MDRLDPGVDLAVEAFEFEVEFEFDRLEVPLPRPRGFNFIGVCPLTGDISGNEDTAFRFLDPVPSNDGNEEDGADG